MNSDASLKNLWQLAVNQAADVTGISENLDGRYRQRLLDLGIQPGESIFCVRKTPFGGPKIFQMRESLFSFDQEISESILIDDDGPRDGQKSGRPNE